MRRYPWRTVIFIVLILSLATLSLVFPRFNLNFLGIQLDRDGMVLGLDLQGGTHLVYEADVEDVTEEQMAGVLETIERRVNAFGVSEPDIRLLGDDRVLVQLPGVSDVEAAKQLIGQTATLEYKERDCPDVACLTYSDKEIGLTGSHLMSASANTHPTTGAPLVSLRFNQEGAKLLYDVTSRLQGSENRMAIFLDDNLLFAGVVPQAIRNGAATLEGGSSFNSEYVRTLAIQLESGRLPTPIKVIQERDVDASLGAESLEKSLLAGVIGLVLVGLFMLIYYRLPGFLAALALAAYTVIVLSIFKLIPVTLTLSGIAAFILSVGMAVDANILIFERMKEELHLGRTLRTAVEVGFDRAWTSIRDSNISTLITCIILWWFGDRMGTSLVVGFAVTLAIGVLISMFTAITISRTLMRVIALSPLARHLGLYLPIRVEQPNDL